MLGAPEKWGRESEEGAGMEVNRPVEPQLIIPFNEKLIFFWPLNGANAVYTAWSQKGG